MVSKRDEQLIAAVTTGSQPSLPLTNRNVRRALRASQMSFIRLPTVSGHSGSTPDVETLRQAARIRRINNQLLLVSLRLAQDDVTTGRVRFAMISLMSLTTLAVGAAFIIIAVTGAGNIAALSVTGGITVLALASVFFVNPVQTVERDMVFRRWSDTIVASFLDQIADEATGFNEIARAQRLATKSFALLAASYGSVSGKANEVLLGAISALTASSAADEKDDTPTTITIENPGPQKSTINKEIAPLKISATGPGTLTFTAKLLPRGLNPFDGTDTISGTPTKAGKSTVVITVKSDEDDATSSSVSFTWTIEAADSAET